MCLPLFPFISLFWKNPFLVEPTFCRLHTCIWLVQENHPSLLTCSNLNVGLQTARGSQLYQATLLYFLIWLLFLLLNSFTFFSVSSNVRHHHPALHVKLMTLMLLSLRKHTGENPLTFFHQLHAFVLRLLPPTLPPVGRDEMPHSWVTSISTGERNTRLLPLLNIFLKISSFNCIILIKILTCCSVLHISKLVENYQLSCYLSLCLLPLSLKMLDIQETSFLWLICYWLHLLSFCHVLFLTAEGKGSLPFLLQVTLVLPGSGLKTWLFRPCLSINSRCLYPLLTRHFHLDIY